MKSNWGSNGRVSIVVVFLLAFAALPAFVSGQNEQMERFRQRRDQAIKAAADREKGVTAEQTASKLPGMNVDVQMVLTRAEYPNFAAAKPNPAAKILDGETLWMYVRFNGKLANFVGEPVNGEDGTPRYRLYAEIGPKGDITALNRYVLVFREEDLGLTELKINLSPGLKGRNASMPIVLDRAGASNPGVWHNEIRISNTTVEPRPITMNLASAPVTFDLVKGSAGYKRLQSAYDTVLTYGASAPTAKPVAGKFESERVRQEVKMELKGRSQDLIDVHFVSDDWSETFVSMPMRNRSRSVLAIISFSNEGKCFEGVARIRETYDESASKFGPIMTDVKDSKAIPCAPAN